MVPHLSAPVSPPASSALAPAAPKQIILKSSRLAVALSVPPHFCPCFLVSAKIPLVGKHREMSRLVVSRGAGRRIGYIRCATQALKLPPHRPPAPSAACQSVPAPQRPAASCSFHCRLPFPHSCLSPWARSKAQLRREPSGAHKPSARSPLLDGLLDALLHRTAPPRFLLLAIKQRSLCSQEIHRLLPSPPKPHRAHRQPG